MSCIIQGANARATRACFGYFSSPSLASRAKAGAGEGNRTLVISLEGCCSTIELHPRNATLVYQRTGPPSLKLWRATSAASQRKLVGEVVLPVVATPRTY